MSTLKYSLLYKVFFIINIDSTRLPDQPNYLILKTYHVGHSQGLHSGCSKAIISAYKSLYQGSWLHLCFYDLDLLLWTRVQISVMGYITLVTQIKYIILKCNKHVCLVVSMNV